MLGSQSIARVCGDRYVFTSNLPILVVNTLGEETIPDEPKVEGQLDIYLVGGAQPSHAFDRCAAHISLIGGS